eukprot:c15646_g1_i1.p1 GENE.c15646_g1_i1~~c15646_g1_i1.p1  ORF type:complete len:404 (+),score=86.07 c15646_g1_i1:114-1325(+)
MLCVSELLCAEDSSNTKTKQATISTKPVSNIMATPQQPRQHEGSEPASLTSSPTQFTSRQHHQAIALTVGDDAPIVTNALDSHVHSQMLQLINDTKFNTSSSTTPFTGSRPVSRWTNSHQSVGLSSNHALQTTAKEKATTTTPTTSFTFASPSTPPSQSLSSCSDSDSNTDSDSAGNFAQLVVFIGEITNSSSGHTVSVHATNETLFAFASRIQSLFAIPVQAQKIKVLSSPSVVSYCMKSMTQEEARAVILPTTSAILIETDSLEAFRDQQSPPFSSPLRVGRFLKAQAKRDNHKTADPVQNHTREQVTAILNDRSKQISLDSLARITDFSKSSLSLWRRDVYNGNNALVTVAISNALKILEECDYQYNPQIHDSACAVAKRKVTYKNPRRNKKQNIAHSSP